MPTYDYRCKKCGEVFEAFQSIKDDPLKTHPGCGGRVNRVFAPVGIVFKGSGFHKTDSRSSGRSAKSAPAGGDGASSNGSTNGSSKEPSKESGHSHDAGGASSSDAGTKAGSGPGSTSKA